MNLEDTIFTFSFWSNLAFHVLESGFAGFLESSLSGIDSRFKTCWIGGWGAPRIEATK